jgi:hypothetical protein
MPRRKKQLGKDAICSVLARMLHPSVHVRNKFVNMNKNKRIEGLRAVRLEKRVVQHRETECVIMTTNDFMNDGVHIEMYCARKFCNVDVEGSTIYFFNAAPAPDEVTVEAEVVEEEIQEADETTIQILRTATIRPDNEDVMDLQGEVEIDDDNQPAPENVPAAGDYSRAVTYASAWGHIGICHRRLAGAAETKPTINFPSSFSPTLVDLFDLLFPKKFIIDVIIKETNKHLKLGDLTYGEFLRWIGLWHLMATIMGPERHDFWKVSEIDVHDGAPFRLNNLMSRNRFDDILNNMVFTNVVPPAYKDRFHHVRQMIECWNANIQENFNPGWTTCLDESMSTWSNQYTCPGFMFVPRKPWPFGNEYHSICCGLSGIMFGVELVEGKDCPNERPPKQFDNLGKTVGLLLRLCKPLWGTAKMVVLDSGFCVLKGIVELKKRGVYAAALIKKRRYWPKHINGDDVKAHFEDKDVGEIGALGGTMEEVPFHVYAMKEPDYTMMMMTTYGTMEREGKFTKRKLNNGEAVIFQYPEVIANHFKYRHIVDDHNAKRHAPISLEVVFATKQWERRVFTFLLAVTEVNVMLAATYFYNKPVTSMLQFRKEYSKELIYNNEMMKEQKNDEKRVTRASAQYVHELCKIPKGKKFKGSRLVKSAMEYGQYKCIGCKRKVRTYCKCSLGVIYCPEHYAKHILEVNN